MASQVNPNDDPSPASVLSAHSQAQRNTSDTAEDRPNHVDEGWSDEEGEEEGPKRKRARPLSV